MKKKRVKGKRKTKENKKKLAKLENLGELKLFFFIILTSFVFVLDRYTKLLSKFWKGCFIFCIDYSTNYGAAFNLLNGFGWTRAFLIFIAIGVLFFTAFFYFKSKDFNYFYIGLILLFAGTLANLFDRIYFGYVIDWITFNFPFPAFNLADASNLTGVIILIWS